eukprot:7377000-Prymnesium_polylepis.1
MQQRAIGLTDGEHACVSTHNCELTDADLLTIDGRGQYWSRWKKGDGGGFQKRMRRTTHSGGWACVREKSKLRS